MSGGWVVPFGERMKDHPRSAPSKRIGRSWFVCWKLYSYRGRTSSLRMGPRFFFQESSKQRANKVARLAVGAQYVHWEPIPEPEGLKLIDFGTFAGVLVQRENAL